MRKQQADLCKAGLRSGTSTPRPSRRASRSPTARPSEVETDGFNPQHVGVLNAFAGHILRGEPLVAEGYEGINGLTLSNAMHLSSWLGHAVDLPLDEDLFLDELNKRRATSRLKTEDKGTVEAQG